MPPKHVKFWPHMKSEDLLFRTVGSTDVTILRSVSIDTSRACDSLNAFLDNSILSTQVDPESKAILLKLQSSLQA
jgi:hypothetical protein